MLVCITAGNPSGCVLILVVLFRCQTAGRIPGGLRGQDLVTLKTSPQPGVPPAPLKRSSTAAAWVLRVTAPWLRPCQGLLAMFLLVCSVALQQEDDVGTRLIDGILL